MSDRPQGDHGGPGAEQVIGKERELILISQVLNHLECLGTLSRPGPTIQIVRRPAVPRMDVNGLAREGSFRLTAHLDQASQQHPRLE